MATREPVGTLARLWRFPVKSMLGEQIDVAELSGHGLLGDRAYGLIEAATGKVVSAKNVTSYPDLFKCRAWFADAPRRGEVLPPVRIALPDGKQVSSDAADADRILSAFFRRDVLLTRTAPDEFTIDQYVVDVAAADAGRVSAGKLGAALFAQLGVPSPVPVGSFLDVFPLSLLTTSTLAQLNRLRDASRFDERRFRMNVIVDTHAAGFVENHWVDRTLEIGAVRLRVTMPDPRCVMTTLAQGDLPKDIDILRTLVRHNTVPVGSFGKLPCAGVYATITAGGIVRCGDQVILQ
jgi:uncharacterized protein